MIEISDLHKRYAKAADDAVAGVSFDVRPGEIFGLLGPNGAGKSTTVGIVTTRIRPTSGTVLVDGLDVTREPIAVRMRIAVVPQRSNLDRSLSPIENLTFHAAYFGVGRKEREALARQLLDDFGLADRAKDNVMFYSGGMAQRVMLARALMHTPRLLILDEPTSGLDPQSRLFLQEKVLGLRETGSTIVLCTHDMAEADRMCDRVAIVDHGRIIALDTPRGLRSLLPGAHGIELSLRHADGVAARFGQLEGIARVEALPASGGRSGSPAGPPPGAGPGMPGGMPGMGAIAPSPPDSATGSDAEADGVWRGRLYTAEEPGSDFMGRVLRVAMDAGAEVMDLRRIEGSLEDVFIHLTGRDLR